MARFSSHAMSLVLLCVLVAMSATASGQAYCALRDPVSSIYTAYPEADSYRSIIRTIGADDRRAIATQLPFTIHFDELGRHTLYVAVQDGQPIGLVHVRSERGRYGLTELAWSMDLDMRILDVHIQRSRDPDMWSALDESFRQQLKGVTLEDIKKLSTAGVDSNHRRVIARSAAKTMVVTDLVWRDDLRPMRAMLMAADQLGVARARLRQRDMDAAVFTPASGVIPTTAQAWYIQDESDALQGTVIRTDWSIGQDRAEVWWILDRDDALKSVQVRHPQGIGVAEAFERLYSGNVLHDDVCDTAAGVAAGEVLRAVSTGDRK